ncbi:urea transporter [Pseudomonas akapageensis]|uniref:urea transporter n=1 Tax=Pseudomonas akapageensis TaxID=2609961 RepID=UPI00140E9436|nr:urea transporter [Pseudomonas akapageensis]
MYLTGPTTSGVRALFFGISQSVFQQNGYTGLILLGGVFLSSPRAGLAALLGLFTSTGLAWAMGAERGLVLIGVYGFNGFFSGLAVASFLEPIPGLWLVVAIGGALAAVLTTALRRLLGRWQLPVLSAPFVCVMWLILLLAIQFDGLAHAADPLPGLAQRWLAASARPWWELLTNEQGIASVLLNGTLRGVSQIFCQDDPLVGLIFLIGLLASSARAATLAAAGALTGTLVALLIGAQDWAIFHGLYGFNSVLSALAVLTLSAKPGWRTPIAALLCAAVAAIATGVMIPLLRPAGLLVLSAPFCLASWTFLLALQERHPVLQ